MNLRKRRLSAPQLTIGDGALGFWYVLNEVWPDAWRQRRWMHKMGNVLNHLLNHRRTSAKRNLLDSWQAATKAEAACELATFQAICETKYPDAAECLVKARDIVHVYDFPAERWCSIRTTNSIDSTFGTIRHRGQHAKGCVSHQSALHLTFQLGCVAETQWRRPRGIQRITEIGACIPYADGIKIEPTERIRPRAAQKAG